ncbi:MAG: transketolase C-terminal domain-containing protein, partial [Sphaerochaetaceae bacterium]|nr:transketolase C-terminal domain-containing protein [Sphaerochaetaceae bacterium]
LIPIGKADIKQKGNDVSIITYGKTVFTALEAARLLEDDDISAEVVDLRTLRPLDKDAIIASVVKTGRAVVVHEAPLFGGFSGEIVATIAEHPEAFRALKAPVARVCGLDMPTPFNKHLELELPPSHTRIIDAVLTLFRS